MNTEADMLLHEIAAEIGHGLLTQLPSALLATLTMTAVTAISRRRRRNRGRGQGDGDTSGG